MLPREGLQRNAGDSARRLGVVMLHTVVMKEWMLWLRFIPLRIQMASLFPVGCGMPSLGS